ncbi:hypothetical protein LN042_06900 [Kitasatospora sp. RB6PN24]|uniref:hypothetical protein n=1 Tax=Kitasatospora humi TaxID=2893891 RepID=UPI001E2F09A6|nr:hypothetical protein [Kitasatospora humi]MCC9306834.1 hypothetical protein [Kitasatospora humi]
MSDTIGSPQQGGGTPATGPSTLQADAARGPVPTVREAYSFVCLNCGYGWEQAYQIEHHKDRDGKQKILYRANGVRVPSPLLQPTCPGCGGHTVRIMREGRVASTRRSSTYAAPGYAFYAEPPDALVSNPYAQYAGLAGPADDGARRPRRLRRHWYQFWLPRS